MNPSKPIASDKWLVFVINLPSTNTALRMRIWRAMKALGCAVMRDGVYLLPAGRGLRQTLRMHAEEIKQSGGHAYLLNVGNSSTEEKHEFQNLFDRSNEYQSLSEKIRTFLASFATLEASLAKRQIKELRRELENLNAIDFFPKPARFETEDILADAESAFLSGLSPNTSKKGITQHTLAEYQNRLWATRTPLSPVRLACIWLIRSQIDPGARFLWLQPMADHPAEAIGFAFDQAEFSPSSGLTSYEYLLTSFGLNQDAALASMARVVNALESGTSTLPEAGGMERLLQGARRNSKNETELVESAMRMFDLLHAAYSG